MVSGIRNKSLSSTLLIAGAGCALMSGMIWTVLTEPTLGAAYWPDDIHRLIVTAFGGNSGPAGGPLKVELSWFSVSLRVASVLFAGGTIAGLCASIRGGVSGTAEKLRVIDCALRCVLSIAVPWLFAGLWLAAWLWVTMLVNPSLRTFFVTTSPLWSAVICAASLSGLLGSVRASDAQPEVINSGATTGRMECLIVGLAAVAWVSTSFWMNERLYAGLLVPHGDSAMYEEHLWNVWHGKGFRSYLDQGLFLGEHLQVIHLLLLPVHILWPSYLMMELVASSSLAVCVFPIFSIARRHSGSRRAAMWLALAWLVFYPMHFLDLAIDIKTLRPSCYGLPFLFWGIDSAERRRLMRASVCFLIALSTQEDFALIVGPIGAVLFWTSWHEAPTPEVRRFRFWSLGLLLFSVMYVLVAVLVVIPYFRSGAAVHYSQYFGDLGGSPGELFQTAVTEPLKVLAVFFSLRTLLYFLVLILPSGLWSLRRPGYLLAGLLTFVMLSLMQLGNGPSPELQPGSVAPNEAAASSVSPEMPLIPFHHFHAPLLPVIFWAAAAGLKTRTPWWLERFCSGIRAQPQASASRVNACRWFCAAGTASDRARFVFCCALLTSVTGSLMPLGVNFWSEESSFGWKRLYVPGIRAREFPKVLKQLPATARVASTDFVHTRLTHFQRSYDYSDYPRAINNYQAGVPADTDYIVIDTSHAYSRFRKLADVRELQTEPDQWEVLPDETNGLFIVLKRRRP